MSIEVSKVRVGIFGGIAHFDWVRRSISDPLRFVWHEEFSNLNYYRMSDATKPRYEVYVDSRLHIL